MRQKSFELGFEHAASSYLESKAAAMSAIATMTKLVVATVFTTMTE